MECYKSAYGIEPYFKDYSEIIKEYLFEGGKKEVYKDNLRDYEDTPPLKEVIGEENANKVKELFENCQGFYRFDSTESNAFDWQIFATGPTCNPKTVIEYWKEQGVELEIDEEKITKEFFKEVYGDDYED